MATFTFRRVKRRGPKVVAPGGEWVMPAPGQWSKVLRVKPLDVVLRRLIKRLYGK
jgi:hypothetical protein